MLTVGTEKKKKQTSKLVSVMISMETTFFTTLETDGDLRSLKVKFQQLGLMLKPVDLTWKSTWD